jgi:hypothetical protein
MDAVTKDVQGTALYLEFTQPTSTANATLMMLFTPDGFSEDGTQVDASLYRRVVTDYAPKRQWRNTILKRIDLARALPAGDEFRRKRLAEERLIGINSLFAQVSTQGWTLVKQPVIIEVSKRDLLDIAARKTPSKIIYRINQSRKALGFPTTA